MSVEIGIIGLPRSGRTTTFNALTGGKADTSGYTGKASAAHVGIARITDPRLQVLTDILKPKKTVPISVSYIDIGASVKGLVTDKTIGGTLLNQLSNVDALINIVRAFSDESIPHSEGSLDTERDIANMNLELAFSDLAIIERRLDRINESLKGAKQPERQALLHEQDLLKKIQNSLEKDIPVRELELTGEENRIISHYQFLTAKPLLIVVNINEDQLAESMSLEERLNTTYASSKCRVIALCSKLEMELVQLEDESAGELRAEYGLTESVLDRVIKLSYELLGLISFFTIASAEVKAWSITNGTEAINAAGKIHSDMEKGFIRAETISFDALVKCGSIAEARKKGLLRMEGKTYQVQDGDVITFLFNV